ncbi:MAG: hypothetical protein H6Q89_3628 [Myxococcaceae bacterium]|nr:hypothetical protein [Myxococcaceae bacterium]
MKRALICLVTLGSMAAAAGEATYVFRSEEDAATPADATVCAQSPFGSNVRLGASLWSIKTRKHNGRVVEEQRKKIGRATACLELTNVMFPQGLVQNFYVRFDLPQGAYVAQGTCTVSSNAVPQPFIILAGCTLRIVSGPAGSLGGMVTSSSIFNPLRRPGYSTGSIWTLQEYLLDAAPSHHDDEDD